MAKNLLNSDIYGSDETGLANDESSRVLGVPDPTLDVNGEKDGRAQSAGNHGKQG